MRFAVPAEELAVDDRCGNASTFEVRPDLLRQEAVVPLRDVSRGEYGFNMRSTVRAHSKPHETAKVHEPVYLCQSRLNKEPPLAFLA